MTNYLLGPVLYIIQALFTLYIVFVMLRLIFQYIHADFYNPFSQFIVKVTTPALIPIRRVVPALGKIDLASVVLLLLLELILQTIIHVLHSQFSVQAILFISLAHLVKIFLYVFEFSIFLVVIVSWLNPGAHNPILSLVESVAAPILKPLRQRIPPISGIDFSPLFAILAIEVTRMLVLPPLYLAAGS